MGSHSVFPWNDNFHVLVNPRHTLFWPHNRNGLGAKAETTVLNEDDQMLLIAKQGIHNTLMRPLLSRGL